MAAVQEYRRAAASGTALQGGVIRCTAVGEGRQTRREAPAAPL